MDVDQALTKSVVVLIVTLCSFSCGVLGLYERAFNFIVIAEVQMQVSLYKKDRFFVCVTSLPLYISVHSRRLSQTGRQA